MSWNHSHTQTDRTSHTCFTLSSCCIEIHRRNDCVVVLCEGLCECTVSSARSQKSRSGVNNPSCSAHVHQQRSVHFQTNTAAVWTRDSVWHKTFWASSIRRENSYLWWRKRRWMKSNKSDWRWRLTQTQHTRGLTKKKVFWIITHQFFGNYKSLECHFVSYRTCHVK